MRGIRAPFVGEGPGEQGFKAETVLPVGCVWVPCCRALSEWLEVARPSAREGRLALAFARLPWDRGGPAVVQPLGGLRLVGRSPRLHHQNEE